MLAHATLGTASPSMDSVVLVKVLVDFYWKILITIICVLDDDECTLGTAACNHQCTDTEGSYTCSCFPGYILDDDQQTCIGKC